MKLIKFLFIIFLFFLSSIGYGNSKTKVDLVDDISKNLRCLICQGQSIYDSNSDFAESMKIMIKKKLTKEKVKKKFMIF